MILRGVTFELCSPPEFRVDAPERGKLKSDSKGNPMVFFVRVKYSPFVTVDVPVCAFAPRVALFVVTARKQIAAQYDRFAH